MRKSLKSYVMILALCAVTVKAQEKLPLKLIVSTPMPGFTGDFDHFGLDLKGNRLFLAAEEHKTVEVFDLRTGERIHSIPGFGQPLMMVYLPESNRLVVTDGGDSAVHLVDCKKYKIIETIKLGQGVDHGVLDPVNKYYYVESGGGSNAPTHVLAIIDTKSFRHIGDVAGLPGSSNEGMVIDRAGKKLYVNLTDTADGQAMAALENQRPDQSIPENGAGGTESFLVNGSLSSGLEARSRSRRPRCILERLSDGAASGRQVSKMPDFRAYVRQNLPPLGISDAQEAEIVEELALDFQESYEHALRSGLDAEQAWQGLRSGRRMGRSAQRRRREESRRCTQECVRHVR